ncbi:MAG: type II secretion system F family protein [Acidiferrobacter sp.]
MGGDFGLSVVIASIGGAVSALLLVLGTASLWSEVPAEDRTYLDPLAPRMRLVWPLVRVIAYVVTARLPTAWLERTHRRLLRAGAAYLVSAEDYLALRVFAGIVCGLAGLWSTHVLHTASFGPSLVLAAGGSLLPTLWLHERRQRRNREIGRLLPVYLDYITLAVEAGLNFAGALAQAVDKGPQGPMRREFLLVLRDVKAGLPRAQALKRMDERLDLPEIGAFVSAVNQAERTGAVLGKVLRAQAERSRMERFQRAEKAAMEAPVKLIAPLVIFIFPTTFLIIAFPIVVMFLHSGGL